MISRRPFSFSLFVLCCGLLSGCVGTAGGELLELQAAAAGPSDAQGELRFVSSRGYQVELREARLFVGGVYLNRSRPPSVASDTSCSQAGIYVAEVIGGREIDLLSSTPQPFPQPGFATSDPALSGEVWLSRDDVNEANSSVTILEVVGKAAREGLEYPFEGKLSIGSNRVLPPSDPALPGQNPLCKQRIVSPIPVNLRLHAGAKLLLRIDPRGMFANVDFATLSKNGDVYEFADAVGIDQASDNLYSGLRRSSGVYTFSISEE